MNDAIQLKAQVLRTFEAVEKNPSPTYGEINIDPSKHAWAIWAKLVSGLRKRWPGVKIILRADSGFCRWQMLRRCVSPRRLHRRGIAKNERLKALSPKLGQRAERKYRKSGEKAGHRQ